MHTGVVGYILPSMCVSQCVRQSDVSPPSQREIDDSAWLLLACNPGFELFKEPEWLAVF